MDLAAFGLGGCLHALISCRYPVQPCAYCLLRISNVGAVNACGSVRVRVLSVCVCVCGGGGGETTREDDAIIKR